MKKRFLNYSLAKKANVTLFILVIIPVFILGIVLMCWLYRSNTSSVYEENYRNLKTGLDKLEMCYEQVMDLPMECMKNEPLQRIGTDRVVGKDYIEVRKWIDETYQANPFCENICISLNNGKQFQAGKYVVEDADEIMQKLGERSEQMWAVGEHPRYALSLHNTKQQDLITYIAKIEHYYQLNAQNYIGTISVRMKENEVSKLYEEEMEKGFEKVFLTGSSGTVVSSTDKEDLHKENAEISDVLGQIKGKQKGMYWRGSSVFFYRYSDLLLCYLVEQVPVHVLYGNIMNIILMLFFAMVLCLIFCVIFGKIQKKYVISPIFELVGAFGAMERAEFVPLPDTGRRDEIGILQGSFNQMTERLDTLVNQVYRADYEKQQAQLRALTEQINPHFLYNTLDSIHWKAIRNKDNEVAEQVLALSDVYRYLLNKGKDYIRVKDEVKFQERYLYLMSMRFGSRVTWESRVEESAMEVLIPKLIIQPLIENAIVYGIEPSSEGGRVILEIRTEADKLVIQVEDTGVGFGHNLSLTNDEVEGLEGAFALKNINHRLKLYEPDGYEYVIQSSESGGSSVMIQMRIKKEVGRNETYDCR